MTDLFFRDSLHNLPKPGDADRAKRGLAGWAGAVAKLDDPELARFARALPDDPAGHALLEAIFANSPFLSHCIFSDLAFFTRNFDPARPMPSYGKS